MNVEGPIKGSLKRLAKKAGLDGPGISEPLKTSEASNHNHIEYPKLGGQIKGSWGVPIQPSTRCKR